ncbi:putative holin-like toxin [Lapidilactobacillus mulanensis]|uniref:Holin-like toxin n=1 Tax=Lapidilactobacillus mulanensis TaxID=2485999 RepID=A0ABW4DKV5_9LACO
MSIAETLSLMLAFGMFIVTMLDLVITIVKLFFDNKK